MSWWEKIVAFFRNLFSEPDLRITDVRVEYEQPDLRINSVRVEHED